MVENPKEDADSVRNALLSPPSMSTEDGLGALFKQQLIVNGIKRRSISTEEECKEEEKKSPQFEDQKVLFWDEYREQQSLPNPTNVEWEEEGYDSSLSSERNVRAASLNKLIQLLTLEGASPDKTFERTFFLTLKTFTTPRIFIERLMERYHVPTDITPPAAAAAENPNDESCWVEFALQVKTRVCEVLESYITHNFSDLIEDMALFTHVSRFIQHEVPALPPTLGRLRQALLNKLKYKEKSTVRKRARGMSIGGVVTAYPPKMVKVAVPSLTLAKTLPVSVDTTAGQLVKDMLTRLQLDGEMMSSPRLAIADPIFPRLYSPDETLYSDLEGVSPSMNLHLFPEGLGPLAIRIEIPEHNQSKTLVVVPGLTCADIVQKIVEKLDMTPEEGKRFILVLCPCANYNTTVGQPPVLSPSTRSSSCDSILSSRDPASPSAPPKHAHDGLNSSAPPPSSSSTAPAPATAQPLARSNSFETSTPTTPQHHSSSQCSLSPMPEEGAGPQTPKDKRIGPEIMAILKKDGPVAEQCVVTGWAWAHTRECYAREEPLLMLSLCPTLTFRLVTQDFFKQKLQTSNATADEAFFSNNILDYDLDQLAAQLSRHMFRLYEAIQPPELLNAEWNKKDFKDRTPNVHAFISDFNSVSSWVTISVLTQEKLKNRARVFAAFVSLADRLCKIQNYNALMAVLSGLYAAPLLRLKYTLAEVPKKLRVRLVELEKLMSAEGSYKNYRKALNEGRAKATLPYVGVHLSDLLFAEEGNASLHNGLVHYRKRVLLYQLITRIQEFQAFGYTHFEENVQIEAMLQTFGDLVQDYDEKELYARSLELEPRGASKDQIS